MQLTVPIQVNFDDDKLRELVHQAMNENPDLVLVTRCEKCKHAYFNKDSLSYSCERRGYFSEYVRPTDFCCHGEEKERTDAK